MSVTLGRPLGLHPSRALIEGIERRGWWVVARDGVIESVGPGRPAGTEEIELPGADLVPGLVDLHSDCLEKKLFPRSGVTLPLASAIVDLDAEVTAQGITSHYLCVCLDTDETKLRTLERAADTVTVLDGIRRELRVDHRVHLRVDMTGDGLEVAASISARPVVAMISYMVHLPGLGQFHNEESWWQYYQSRTAGGEEVLEQMLQRRRERLYRIDESRRAVATIAADLGLVLASHDDDTPEAARIAADLGVTISEFPVNVAAARTAVGAGLGVVMGAPNARFGHSHHANLSARNALQEDLLTALASDYHPPSLLTAAYQLAEDRACSWPEAMALVTANPARLAGLGDRGSIEPGRRADMVAVARRAGVPAADQVWVAGRLVLGSR